MKLQSLRALRGPNVWLDRPGLEFVLECGENFPAALTLSLDTLSRRLGVSCSLSFVRGVNKTWGQATVSEGSARLVVLTAQLALDLQPGLAEYSHFVAVRALRKPADNKANGTSALMGTSEWKCVVPYAEERVATQALNVAIELVTGWLAQWTQQQADCVLNEAELTRQLAERVEAARAPLQVLDEEIRLGPSTGGIVRAAQSRGIPVKRLTEGSLVQLGYGIHQRRIWAAETDATSALAEQVAQDKDLTKTLLASAGVSVPRGAVVSCAEEAWQVAARVGLPVAIKPRNGNQGRGVSVHLQSQEAVRSAFEIAAAYDSEVIVEQHIEGEDYRLLVVGDRLIAAARREPPSVIGDGVRSIAELVEVENQDPRRGEDHSNVLSKIRLDAVAEEVLAAQSLTARSVPVPGKKVVLRSNANLSTGGTATDVTDEVHPEVAALAVAAARVVGLDVAGIDLVANAVNVPLSHSRGAVVEVNAAPGLRMHIQPSLGKPRAVGAAIVDMLFAPGQQARVPVVAITGTNGKTTTTRAIAHLLKQQRLRVGMTCTDGIYVEGRRIERGDCAGPKSARAVLAHPRVEAAVLETARGGILREGLGFDWCDVAVVTNIGEGDHLGLNAIDTKEDLALVKSVIVRRVSTTGAAVLNAEDPLVVEMASLCKGSVVFFSRDPNHSVLVSHRARGGHLVTVRDGVLVVEQGRVQRSFGRIEDMPLTHKGRVGFQIDNLLAAAGAAYWLGVAGRELELGLATFSSDLGIAPGRFNVLTHRGSTVIVDYGHNASALTALNEAISQFDHQRRKVVYTAAGDRRDEDIRRQGEILAEFFDEIYIYEDQCTRGRADGEVMRLMREGFERAASSPLVRQLDSEMGAIGAAVNSLQSGDLLLCQIDQVESALEYLTGLLKSEPEQRFAGRHKSPTAASNALLAHAGNAHAGEPSSVRRAPR